jgi:hypothetical protein
MLFWTSAAESRGWQWRWVVGFDTDRSCLSLSLWIRAIVPLGNYPVATSEPWTRAIAHPNLSAGTAHSRVAESVMSSTITHPGLTPLHASRPRG